MPFWHGRHIHHSFIFSRVRSVHFRGARAALLPVLSTWWLGVIIIIGGSGGGVIITCFASFISYFCGEIVPGDESGPGLSADKHCMQRQQVASEGINNIYIYKQQQTCMHASIQTSHVKYKHTRTQVTSSRVTSSTSIHAHKSRHVKSRTCGGPLGVPAGAGEVHGVHPPAPVLHTHTHRHNQYTYIMCVCIYIYIYRERERNKQT
jgi:hypothetical protein